MKTVDVQRKLRASAGYLSLKESRCRIPIGPHGLRLEIRVSQVSDINILVVGSKDFKNYMDFVRAVGVTIDALRGETPGKIKIYTAGPSTINNYTAEFCNVSESTLRSYGFKVSFQRVPWKPTSETDSWGIDRVLTFGISKPEANPHVIRAMLAGVPTTRY